MPRDEVDPKKKKKFDPFGRSGKMIVSHAKKAGMKIMNSFVKCFLGF